MASLSIVAILAIGLVIGAAALLTAFVVSARRTQHPSGIHPADLTSTARALTRPLRQAAENLEKAIAAHAGTDAARILGPEATATASRLVAESAKLGLARDQLQEARRRIQQANGDTAPLDQAIAQIEASVAAATQTIDQMTIRVTQSALATSLDPSQANDEELAALVQRLQNLGDSFDEVTQTVKQSP